MMGQNRSDNDGSGDWRLPPHCRYADYIRREQDGRRQSDWKFPITRSADEQKKQSGSTPKKRIENAAPEVGQGLLHLRIDGRDHCANRPYWIGVHTQPEDEPECICRDENVYGKMDTDQIAAQETLQVLHDLD
jgi:hypothetical protein